jgi:thioredoxin-like negative regulator of GroEL
MAVKVVRVRRKRRARRSFSGLESLALFRHQLTPIRLAVFAAVIAFAIVLTVFVFTYGATAFRGWRETRLVKHAGEMLRQNDYDAAIKAAREVLDLHHDSLAAYQILAEATEKQNLEETVAWRAQIARLLSDNIDSQLNLASAALRFGQLDLARKALQNVPSDQRDHAVYHVVAGWLARAEGNVAEQELQFAAAAKKDPHNDLYQFNLAVLRIRSSDSEKSANARAILQRLAQQSVEFRTGALRALLTDAVERNDLGPAESFAQDLQMAPQVTFADYLLCLNFYRKLEQKKFEPLFEKVKPVAARDPSNVALLMNWMNDNALSGEVLKWMDKLPGELTDKPPAAIAIAEAFAEAKNWSRLRRWTRNGSWGDADHLRLAYQAFSAHQSRQSTADAEFESLWQAAERIADDQADRQAELARLATKWNLSIEAEQLWSRLSRNGPTRREALDALYRIYRRNNDLKKLYDVLQRLHENSPNEEGITANLARLGLNIDQNTKQAQELAKAAYDRAPFDTNCAITYAFSLFATGRTTEALDAIKKLAPEQLHDPHAAVYAAVFLLDDNQIQAAKEYVDIAQRGGIYVEEKRLLEDELVKVTGVSPTPSVSPTARPTPTATPAPTQAPSLTPAKSTS